MEKETAVYVENVTKSYQAGQVSVPVLNHISFTVYKGEMLAVVGDSGSGKTTLMNLLGALDIPDSGKIRIGKREISGMDAHQRTLYRRNSLGFIFQDFNLLDTMTAYENIALALSIQKVKAKEINQRVMEIAGALDIVEILDKYPYQMSGGQKQRVASARAVITRPKLVLADEPTGALDSKSARMLLQSMEYLNQELGTTILMVTHDAFTASYANRILFIKDGQLFTELLKEKGETRKTFFNKIIDVVTLLGGELQDVV